MERARHCELCDHQQVTLKEGSLCGLTERKPDFNRTCIQISLSEKFRQKLLDANVHHQQILKRQAWVAGYFTIFMILGIAIIIGASWFAYYLFNLTEMTGKTLVYPFGLIGIGVAVMTMANGSRNKYRKDLAEAKHKKDKIDSVLEVYNINYDINIELGRIYHGKQEMKVDARFSGGMVEDFSWIGEGPSRRW